MHTLVTANQIAHARFIAALERALVSLTELDTERARDAWNELGTLLAAHQLIEEELLAHAVAYSDATSPRGGAPSLILAEHRRLDQVHGIAAVKIAVLDRTPITERRLATVRALDDFLRLRHLLEHHGAREDQIVYPHLMSIVAPDVAAGFAARLADDKRFSRS